MKQFLYQLFILFSFLTSGAQETPPIINYTTSDYNAENQNWDISQDENLFIYAANNEGLLQFNGEEWNLFKSPNSSIPRSVLAHDNRIYYGAFMEFGYFLQNGVNEPEYVSLSKKIDDQLLEDENIWHIKEFNGYILFQSYDRIYFYNITEDTTSYITDENNYYRLFKTNNKIYAYKRNGWIVNIEDGREVKVARFNDNDEVQFVLELYDDKDGLVVLTRNKGFFRVKDREIEQWNKNLNEELKDYKIFCGIRLRNQSWVLGTISKGLLFIDRDGNIQNHINIKNGLGNNTVLNLFEDIKGNLWAALDNGIDCINLTSFITEFNDFDGILGTVYASVVHKDKLFLGTNQGLFSRNLSSNDSFSLVNGSAGQVWSLFVYNNDLLCGHTDGTFLIDNNQAIKVGSTFGTWGFREIPNYENTLLLGNYNGMSVLQKVSGTWIDKGIIEGFSNSARFIEILDDLTVYVNHEYKGIFRLRLKNNLEEFINVERIGNITNSKGSGLTKINDRIIYKNEKGVYTVNEDSLVKDEKLSELSLDDKYLSGKLIVDKSNRLWSFNNNSIVYSKKGPVNNNLLVEEIPLENTQKKTTVSFENITQLEDHLILLGRTNGYLILNLNKRTAPSPNIFLTEISIDSTESLRNLYEDEGITVVEHFQNTLEFGYSVPDYFKFHDVKYQYQLDGISEKWSSWTDNYTTKFENLNYGNYDFKVRAKIGNVISPNIESFKFKIKPPFYLSKTALSLYVIGFLLILLFVHKSYKTYYRRLNEKAMAENQRELELERAKNDQELIKIRNQQLNKEIEAKNREVAISMMSIAKRNEVLKNLTKELEKKKSIPANDPIYKLIKKNSNPNRDWEMFKKAFDQADLDFLKRIKERHPKLTPNDLKFCAYLRLNLTSKEIAPILNISVKSVEVRRYRLRKKLNLEHKDNLTDYIISI